MDTLGNVTQIVMVPHKVAKASKEGDIASRYTGHFTNKLRQCKCPLKLHLHWQKCLQKRLRLCCSLTIDIYIALFALDTLGNVTQIVMVPPKMAKANKKSAIASRYTGNFANKLCQCKCPLKLHWHWQKCMQKHLRLYCCLTIEIDNVICV